MLSLLVGHIVTVHLTIYNSVLAILTLHKVNYSSHQMVHQHFTRKMSAREEKLESGVWMGDAHHLAI
jgi:hypothetical protein